MVCAGASDLPVAEEAGMTLRAMGAPFVRSMNVGVSGLHRLLPHVPVLQRGVCAWWRLRGWRGHCRAWWGGWWLVRFSGTDFGGVRFEHGGP